MTMPEPTDEELTDLFDQALAAQARVLEQAAILVREVKAEQAAEDTYREKRRAQWRAASAKRRAWRKAIGLAPEGRKMSSTP